MFNELMYHPAADQSSTEWLELHNQMAVDMDLSGWSFDGIDYQFPQNTTLPGGGYLVVAQDPADLEAQHAGLTGVMGPFQGRLSNGGEELILRNANGRAMDSLSFGDRAPWPAGADGGGVTLAKQNPQSASNLPSNWIASPTRGGSPGSENIPVFDTTPIVTSVISRDATWSYRATDSPAPPNWHSLDFNDDAWPTATAVIYAGQFPTIAPPETGQPLTGRSAIVQNSSFEDNTNGGVGYGSVDAWGNLGTVGINPTTDGSAPFADNGGIPDNRQIAFIQGRGSVAQAVQGLEVGQDYLLQVHYNARNCCGGTPVISISLGGQVLLEPTAVNPVADGESYHVASLPFTANSATAQLLIRNVGSTGDHSLLLDAVSISPIEDSHEPLLNPSFEASGTLASPLNAQSGRSLAGWNYQGDGRFGIATAGDEWVETQAVPDGSHVLYLSGAGQIHQQVNNLTPGDRYEFVFDARAADAEAHLEVEINGQPIATESIPATQANDSFQSYYVSFIAPAAEVQLALRQANATSTLLVDRLALRRLDSPLVGEVPLGPTTYYFRHEFDFAGTPSQTELQLSHYLDDGAVVYLNGEEIYRQNLPAGPVSSNTLATSIVGDPAWSESVLVSSDALRNGRNVLAVEVHQVDPASQDMAWSLELISTEIPVTPTSPVLPLFINEVSQAGGSNQIELYNAGVSSVALRLASLTVGDETVPLPNESLAPGAALSVVVPHAVTADELVVLREMVTSRVLDAIHVTSYPQARMPNGTGPFYRTAATTLGQMNDVVLEDAIVINEIMYHDVPFFTDQGTPPTYDLVPLVEMGGEWLYNASGASLPSDWHTVAHAVGGEWQRGPALLGAERSSLPAPGIVTELDLADVTTYYFESQFSLTDEMLSSDDLVQFRHVIDDGAIFYINGRELTRFNMASGPVTSSTLANVSVNNAELSDLATVPKDFLQVGINRISVEVHQRTASSSDLVFGTEVVYAQQIDPGVPATAFHENEDEWIELYNRSNLPVDLTGWSLDDAVNFQFPAGTVLSPKDYLVIASNPAKLASENPNIRVLGSLNGQLRNSDERIVLRNALGNPVDEVHYFDKGRWAWQADGGGASLELRDPDADNSIAESWGASQVSGGEWKTYTVRAAASNPRNLNVPDFFDEFIIGLLDEGVVLLDDLQLIEDPDGAAIDRLQNGTFTSDTVGEPPAHWQWIGNHEETVVDVDPDDANNHVLKLISRGSTEHMSNHGFSTLADGARIQDGQIYEFSFRAKWLYGSPQLNTRLYFARMAETTVLDTHRANGSPGVRNTVATENAGPTFQRLRHEPLSPEPNEEVTVSVDVDDPDAVSAVVLHYSVEGDPFQQLPMARSRGNSFVGVIPAQARGDVVSFYVTAVDSLGGASSYPAAGPESNALYEVAGAPATRDVHSLQVIMTRDAMTHLHANSNVMSNGRVGATVIYNNQEVFYDVGVRLRASGYGRQGGLAGFNIQFDPQQLFRGVHSTIALDRGSVFSDGTGGGGVRGVPGASPHELIFYQIAHRAGGIAGMYDDVVYVDAPRSNNTGFALLKLARYSDEFLDSQFDNGSDGDLFKYELIYHATTTVDGNPESLKRAPNAVIATDITDLGPDADAYRFNYVLKNNTDEDDFSGIIRLGQAFSESGPELERATDETIDVEQWMRTFALYSLTGVADAYNMGLPHNLELYVRPEDDKVLAFPWDVDHGFYYSPRASILGLGGTHLQNVIAIPKNRRLFYKHLLDIVENAYNAETVTPWAQHYTEITGHGSADFFIDYVTERAAYVISRIDAAVPPADFAITTNGGNAITTNQTRLTLTGQGWIDVHQVRFRGTNNVLPIQWLDETQWQVELPLTTGLNNLELEAFNYRGEPVGSDSIAVTSTATVDPARDFLRVTEVMYHPPSPTLFEASLNASWDDESFEYVELMNIAPSPSINLAGIRFTDGPSEVFEFSDDAGTLEPGERLVLVANRAAFVARYGTNIRIGGEYLGSLRNSGEPIRFATRDGDVIVEFTYDDQSPWPEAADGSGPSLELKDVTTSPLALGDASQWQASANRGGTPGRAIAPTADFNADGLISANDIDLLCQASESELAFDLTQDGRVDRDDLDMLVRNILGTTYGDANLDGLFNTSDLVQIFQLGQYEDRIENNSTWSSGDWNCDGEFTSSDLVVALQHGGFIKNAVPRRASAATTAEVAAAIQFDRLKQSR